jgi:hypothetical protein
MKATFSLITLMAIFIGFAFVGSAFAQPDDPTPAASDSGPTSPESGEAKTEDTKPDETKPAEGEPSEAEGEKAKGEEDTKPAEPTPAETASGFVQALRGGNWLSAIGFGLMLIAWFMRSFLLKSWDWAQTKKGGIILAAAIAVLGVVGLPLASGAGFSFDMILAAFNAMLVSAGLWGWTKDAKEAMAPG